MSTDVREMIAEPVATVVMGGSYSDTHVVAVFTSEALADAWIELMHADQQQVANELREARGEQLCTIEPYYFKIDAPLDPEYVALAPRRTTADPHRRLSGWVVCVSIASGDVSLAEPSETVTRSRNQITNGNLWVSCFASDIEHAKKIATERRQEICAARARADVRQLANMVQIVKVER